jgi:GT2 family glycosyltransferase
VDKLRLVVVIVNYKSAELVSQSLSCLLPQLDRTTDCVKIVDNFSQDHSVDYLNEFIEEHDYNDVVEVIASNLNGGFSYGNNLAISPALTKKNPEYILLLNPDTLMCENSISSLLNFMNTHPRAGIAGSRLEGADGVVQCSAFRFHSLLSELESSLRLGVVSRWLSKWKVAKSISNTACIVDWVAGASMMIRSDVLREVGLMDEDYFLYFEETDFCLQANRHGWECWYVPESRVIHFVGQSTGVVSGNALRPRRPQYWFEARQHYFLKNFGLFYTVFTDIIWMCGFAIWRVRRKIQKKPDTDPEKMLSDFCKNSVFTRLWKRQKQ